MRQGPRRLCCWIRRPTGDEPPLQTELNRAEPPPQAVSIDPNRCLMRQIGSLGILDKANEAREFVDYEL